MSNGIDAARALMEECDAAVMDIKETNGTKSCHGHEPLARGVIVLLRCQRAELERESDEEAEAQAGTRAFRVWLVRRSLLAGAVLAALGLGVALGQGEAVQALVALLSQ